MPNEIETSSLDRRRLELALESARMGEFEWDAIRKVLIVSDRMAAIKGLPTGEYPIENFEGLAHGIYEDDQPLLLAALEAAKRDSANFEVAHRFVRRDNGAIIWLKTSGVMVYDADGGFTGLCGVVQDITDHKQEAEQLRNIMGELDHRVKNVLSAVQALAFQTAKRTTSLDSFLQTFAGRLKAMGAANELLTAARWRGAAIGHLAAAELGGVGPGQTRWEGPELFLAPRAANALSLALHELATNAVKFGALSNDVGRVDVLWQALADGGFELTWIETGGPSVSQPTHRGFGSTLLDQVTGRELNGDTQVEYRSAGVRVTLRASSAAVVARPETVPEAPAPRAYEAEPAADGPTDLRGWRILIVEDAVLLALELESGLQDAGAEVIGPAYELEEALALLNQPVDAAVLDANLNGHSVLPVAEILAARGVPFVFATGYGESGGVGADFVDAPVIRKPYDVTQVAAALSKLRPPPR
jgi:PAS domain S-box-containing protein